MIVVIGNIFRWKFNEATKKKECKRDTESYYWNGQKRREEEAELVIQNSSVAVGDERDEKRGVDGSNLMLQNIDIEAPHLTQRCNV